ncbi:MAG TPA: hypothetical protein DCM38_08610 [Gammaproteobacteria bacterium]|nr:hypothetical protein [Gammaproteobacteria bacterium]
MSKSYKADLLEALRDPSEAAEYLDAAFEEDDEAVFRLALKDVLEAGLSKKITFHAKVLRAKLLREKETQKILLTDYHP